MTVLARCMCLITHSQTQIHLWTTTKWQYRVYVPLQHLSCLQHFLPIFNLTFSCSQTTFSMRAGSMYRSVRFKHLNNTSSVARKRWDWISMGIEEGSAVKTAPVNPWQHFKEVYDIVCSTLYTCVHEKDRAGGNALNVYLNKACLSQDMLVFIGSYLNSARARGIYWDSTRSVPISTPQVTGLVLSLQIQLAMRNHADC